MIPQLHGSNANWLVLLWCTIIRRATSNESDLNWQAKLRLLWRSRQKRRIKFNVEPLFWSFNLQRLYKAAICKRFCGIDNELTTTEFGPVSGRVCPCVNKHNIGLVFFNATLNGAKLPKIIHVVSSISDLVGRSSGCLHRLGNRRIFLGELLIEVTYWQTHSRTFVSYSIKKLTSKLHCLIQIIVVQHMRT